MCFLSSSGLCWYLCLVAIIQFNWKYVAAHNVFCPVSYQLIGAVCGTDGITYPSICDLENARSLLPALDVALLRPCNEYCTENWDPICGSDMVTYANSCIFGNAMKRHSDLRIFHHGQCLTPLADDIELFNEYKEDNHKENDDLGLFNSLQERLRQKDPKRDRKKYSETVLFS